MFLEQIKERPSSVPLHVNGRETAYRDTVLLYLLKSRVFCGVPLHVNGRVTAYRDTVFFCYTY